LVLLIAAFGALSVWLGPDASWDFRNYHLYDAHAALAGTLWTDIAPAQLQSYYDPALDVPFFLLRRGLNAHPALLDFILAVPQAVAVWLVLGIATDLLPGRTAPALATLLGATGAAALPTLGSAMSAMPEACLILLALRRCLPPLIRHPRESEDPSSRRTMGSRFRGNDGKGWLVGLLVGAAAGLKLTASPYAIGLCAALLATRPRAVPTFAAAATIVLLAVAGPWWWIVWRHTGNPLFPYFNNIFHSAWAPAAPFTDTRFLPRGLLQAALFPALWAFHSSIASNELPVRDPRLLLGLLASLWLIATRRDRRTLALAAFWLAAFAAWEARFGILRYADVLELLSGIPIALVVAQIARQRLGESVAALTFAMLAAGVIAATIYPHWRRASPGPLATDVRAPFRPGSLVLLLDPAPMAYVAAFSPAGVRFAGIDSNLVHPSADTALNRAIIAAIARQSGPLWGLESPADQPGQADRTLHAYHLARTGACVAIRSNLDANALRACPLRRLNPLPASAARASRTRRGPG
ncbi:MAG: hypothetical protein ACREFY_08350, partial [Acetobacteraceae bacterium]